MNSSFHECVTVLYFSKGTQIDRIRIQIVISESLGKHFREIEYNYFLDLISEDVNYLFLKYMI